MNINIRRLADIRSVAESRSCFLFGPRQVGKSVLLGQQFSDCRTYDLLDSTLHARLVRNPALIRQELTSDSKIVVIDEVQRLPELLNEVHLMIERHNVTFILTGSSARSLNRKTAQFLGGRARRRRLHPFVWPELQEHFDLPRALLYGLLPQIYFSDSPHEDLESYTADYLHEIVAFERMIRNLSPFGRFLDIVALLHGTMINFEKVSRQAQVPASTVRAYFEILQDTFLIHEIHSFTETRHRKAINTSKFYLFDIGLVFSLQGRRELVPKTAEYGLAFESFILQELVAFSEYKQVNPPTYWRSTSNFEVDFILEDTAIEVSAKSDVHPYDLRGLKAIREENILDRYIVVSMEERMRVVDDIVLMPWDRFLEALWGGELF